MLSILIKKCLNHFIFNPSSTEDKNTDCIIIQTDYEKHIFGPWRPHPWHQETIKYLKFYFNGYISYSFELIWTAHEAQQWAEWILIGLL